MTKIPLRDICYHPTFRCSLSCRGCVNYSNHLESYNIPDETNWHRDLDALFERFDVRHIEVAGGETLMFPHLEDLVNKLSPVKFYTITTNGLLLYKHRWIKDLVDNDQRLQLVISIHGHPLQDSIYIRNLSESLGIFLDKPAATILKEIRRNFASPSTPSRYLIHNGRIKIKQQHRQGMWHYPKLDTDELPVLFNNDKEIAFKNCICPAPHLKDGKIYKCPMMAMLPKVIKSKNISNTKWDYLNEYSPYDLLNEHNNDTWSRLFVAEDVCSKCPVGSHEWDTAKIDLHSKII